MVKFYSGLRCLVLAMTVVFPCATLLAATQPVDLGTAASFGVLAGAAISGSGDVNGNVGSGTGAIAPAITSEGIIYPTGDPVVMTALADFATAYNAGLNRPSDVLLSAAAYELGGTTLTPGVYYIGAAATVTTPVILDGGGDPNAVFIIQVGGAFGATAAVGNVILTNAAQSVNVFWVVQGAVSLGAGTAMKGTILCGAAVSLGAGTVLNGRVLAGSAGTIALATTIALPVKSSVVSGRVWLDSNGDGVQDLTETNGFDVPVALLQIVTGSLTIDLGTAANFGVLAGGAISGSGSVSGNVGSGAGAVAPAITSAGTVYPIGDPVVMTALADFSTAYNAGLKKTYTVQLSAAAYELGGTVLTNGVYSIGAAATLASSVILDGQGNTHAVFIVQVVGALAATAAVGNVVLTNSAKSANVFWLVQGAVALGAGVHMEGNILGGAAIALGAGTTVSGRVLGGSASTVALATTISAVTGTPPVGSPPPVVVANRVADTNGNYSFGSVQPGAYLVRWDLTNIATDFFITTAVQSGDVGGFVYSNITVLAGTTNLVNLGLVESLPTVKALALSVLTTALNADSETNYTAVNWALLTNALAAGNVAINAATDPAEVATAKASALAAMQAVPMAVYIWTAVEVGWNTHAGTNYQVQATTNLQSGQWQNFGAVTMGNGTLMTMFDSTRTNSARFYRVVAQ